MRQQQHQKGLVSSAALCTKASGAINKITSADDAIKLVQVFAHPQRIFFLWPTNTVFFWVQPGSTLFVSGFAIGTGAVLYFLLSSQCVPCVE